MVVKYIGSRLRLLGVLNLWLKRSFQRNNMPFKTVLRQFGNYSIDLFGNFIMK